MGLSPEALDHVPYLLRVAIPLDEILCEQAQTAFVGAEPVVHTRRQHAPGFFVAGSNLLA